MRDGRLLRCNDPIFKNRIAWDRASRSSILSCSPKAADAPDTSDDVPGTDSDRGGQAFSWGGMCFGKMCAQCVNVEASHRTVYTACVRLPWRSQTCHQVASQFVVGIFVFRSMTWSQCRAHSRNLGSADLFNALQLMIACILAKSVGSLKFGLLGNMK